MKIIDLLNKIANYEEVPKKIKWGCHNFEWCEVEYKALDEYGKPSLCEVIGTIECALNDEVEILEEKKIPEKICTNRIINTKDILEFEMIQNKINAEYTYAINSIIDYLKSKGE